MDSTHTILSHSFTVICPRRRRHSPPHPSLTCAHTTPPIRVYGVNNKSCVTSQITQTAYHLFIVVYHNKFSVRTKATASQTQAFVNELGRLPDLKINWQCCWFLPTRVCLFICLCLPPQRQNRDRLFLESTGFSCSGLLCFCTTCLLAHCTRDKNSRLILIVGVIHLYKHHHCPKCTAVPNLIQIM